MNRLLLVVLVTASTGCGFGLTADAKPCGKHASGIEVWVDSPPTLADGGVWQPGPERENAFMTCDQAMETVDAALAIGDSHDFWVDKSHRFLDGMRLEFVGDQNLAAIGEPDKLGFTMNSPFAHDMAVAYGDDGFPDYTLKYDRADPTMAYRVWGSAVTLSHEMIHVLQSDSFLNLGVMNTHTDKHCHWASVYAPRFSDLGWAQYSSNFEDGCEHERCSGSACHAD
jgi:hypothetical protein